jgi:hypothetical protein
MQIVGSESFSFSYTHFGGTNNLLPGRSETFNVTLNVPKGAQVFASITKINFGYINGNTANPPMDLNENPLGQLGVEISIKGNQLFCWMRLSTNDQTVPCVGMANVSTLYFM